MRKSEDDSHRLLIFKDGFLWLVVVLKVAPVRS